VAEARAKEMKKLQEKVITQIEKVNEQYKQKANKNCAHLEFKPGDLVWLHFRKERFPLRRQNKLMDTGDGSYKVVQKVGENAYKIELLGDTQVSVTFNVGDLTPYLEDDEEHDEDLRINPLQGGGVDAEQLPTLGLLSLVRAMSQVGPMLTLGQGLGPPSVNIELGPLKRSKKG